MLVKVYIKKISVEQKNKILLQISLFIGTIAFVGGWAIFLIWTGGRYLSAKDFGDLETVGIFWIFSFFWLALMGVVLLTNYVYTNRKRLHLKMLLAGIALLINIPSVIIILYWQDKIEKKAFVKLKNESGFDFTQIQLQGGSVIDLSGKLHNGSSIVFNYEPKYVTNGNESYPTPQSLNLLISAQDKLYTIKFPSMMMGDCKRIIIDDGFKLQ